MLGFSRVVYVCSQPKEMQWMTLPSKASELSMGIDYANYSSPDPDEPEKAATRCPSQLVSLSCYSVLC